MAICYYEIEDLLDARTLFALAEANRFITTVLKDRISTIDDQNWIPTQVNGGVGTYKVSMLQNSAEISNLLYNNNGKVMHANGIEHNYGVISSYNDAEAGRSLRAAAEIIEKEFPKDKVLVEAAQKMNQFADKLEAALLKAITAKEKPAEEKEDKSAKKPHSKKLIEARSAAKQFLQVA